MSEQTQGPQELSLEAILPALEKPEIKEGLFKHLSSSGLVIRTQDEDKSYLDNHVSAVAEERAKAKLPELLSAEFGKTMGAIDREIMEATGIEKLSSGEKTTAYFKRALEASRAKGGDPITKQRVQELEQMLNSTRQDYETKLSEANSALFKREIEWGVNAALDGVNVSVPAHLKTEQDRQAFVAQQKALIKQGFLAGFAAKRDEQGNIFFTEGDTPLLNQKDGRPKSASEIISERYAAWFVPQTHTATGTGQSAPATEGGALTTKDDVHKYLAAKGMDALSDEYRAEFKRLCAEAKIAI